MEGVGRVDRVNECGMMARYSWCAGRVYRVQRVQCVNGIDPMVFDRTVTHPTPALHRWNAGMRLPCTPLCCYSNMPTHYTATANIR
jgi:hypothetical protein